MPGKIRRELKNILEKSIGRNPCKNSWKNDRKKSRGKFLQALSEESWEEYPKKSLEEFRMKSMKKIWVDPVEEFQKTALYKIQDNF